MGFFDEMAAKSFVQDEKGNFYVLPLGPFLPARRFKNERAYERSRAYLASTYQWMLPLMAGGFALVRKAVGDLQTISVLVAIQLAFWLLIGFRQLTRNTEPAVLSSTAMDTGRATGQLVFMLTGGLVFAALGIAMGVSGKPVGFLIALFFGAIGVSGGSQLLRR